jgi:hypothetical protein
LLPVLLAALAVVPAFPQNTASEEQVRSAFLFQLAQYVTWPDPAGSASSAPLRFCVLADEGLAESLRPVVAGKRIEGRGIEVAEVDGAHGLSGCHLAFIGLKKKQKLKEFFAAWKYPPVLLVGDGDLFVQMGGMVALTIESGKVSFAVNLESTREAHLSLRSQLLRFARIMATGVRK